MHQRRDTIRILDGGRLVACRPILEGRRQYRIDPYHRQGAAARVMRHGRPDSLTVGRRGDHVSRRSLAVALTVEAVKAGRSVVFSTLADLIASLAKAERDGTLRERIRYLCRAALLIVDDPSTGSG